MQGHEENITMTVLEVAESCEGRRLLRGVRTCHGVGQEQRFRDIEVRRELGTGGVGDT